MFEEWNIVKLENGEDDPQTIKMKILSGGEYGLDDEIADQKIDEFSKTNENLENIFLTFETEGIRVLMPLEKLVR